MAVPLVDPLILPNGRSPDRIGEGPRGPLEIDVDAATELRAAPANASTLKPGAGTPKAKADGAATAPKTPVARAVPDETETLEEAAPAPPADSDGDLGEI